MFDFAVCGAGPIGSYLSWRLSSRGYKVLLIEEHSKIGLPLSCSGLVSKRLFSFVPKDSFIERQISGARIHLGSKTYFFPSKQSLVINRTKLDQYLFELAKASGTKTMLSTHLIGFLEKPNSVSLYLKTKSSQRILQTKILAGCDGPLSKIRSSLGIPRPKFLHGIFTYSSGPLDSFVDLYLKNSDFFAWRIPRSTYLEYGLASFSHTKFYFYTFLKKHNVKPKKLFSGLIPFGLLPKISSHRVFLCGDAASTIKPHTGGGVIYGLTCADIASKTINPDKPNLSLFESLVQKKLSKQILLGLLIKKSYKLPSFLLSLSLSILSKKQNLDMDKPTTIFKF